MKLSEAIELCEELAANEDGSHYARALRIVLRHTNSLRAQLEQSRETTRIAVDAHRDAMASYVNEIGVLFTRMDGRIVELERELAKAKRERRPKR